jgi:predicted urease superfamily metal-dependent hydrolase
MVVIHQSQTFILEADFVHDEARDIHTLDLYQTWPTMAKPYRRRMVQLNLPRASLQRLARVIADAADRGGAQ